MVLCRSWLPELLMRFGSAERVCCRGPVFEHATYSPKDAEGGASMSRPLPRTVNSHFTGELVLYNSSDPGGGQRTDPQ